MSESGQGGVHSRYGLWSVCSRYYCTLGIPGQGTQGNYRHLSSLSLYSSRRPKRLQRSNISCWSIMKAARLKEVAVCSNVELQLRRVRDSSQGQCPHTRKEEGEISARVKHCLWAGVKWFRHRTSTTSLKEYAFQHWGMWSRSRHYITDLVRKQNVESGNGGSMSFFVWGLLRRGASWGALLKRLSQGSWVYVGVDGSDLSPALRPVEALTGT